MAGIVEAMSACVLLCPKIYVTTIPRVQVKETWKYMCIITYVVVQSHSLEKSRFGARDRRVGSNRDPDATVVYTLSSIISSHI